jgi:hypothetical protein
VEVQVQADLLEQAVLDQVELLVQPEHLGLLVAAVQQDHQVRAVTDPQERLELLEAVGLVVQLVVQVLREQQVLLEHPELQEVRVHVDHQVLVDLQEVVVL